MSAKSTRAELLKQLRRLGVETVTAEYDGSGDSGQLGDPEFGPIDVSDGRAMAVQDLFYDLLGDLYDGWENNEGSFGHFVWSVQEDKITLRHTIRTEDTEEQDL